MTQLSVQDAYMQACKIIGDQQVKLTLLEQALEQAQAELKEAGERIVELTSQSQDTDDDKAAPL
jgi:hypothetical protein